MDNYNFIGFDEAISVEWRVGIYCRLSKDDELQGESASISNQREMLTNYCKAQGFTIVDIFQDDGYTGLNMDRPGLKQALKAIEDKKINLLLTKDLSRLGRNYLETGRLMEDYFPRRGVRYIAVNDNIDTARDSNEIAPFKNILNEMYSKDISKKVHSSYLLHAKQGKYTGVVPPFGYLKDPNNKGHLIVDGETAWVVRKIFDYAMESKGSNYIRRRLEREKIACPCWWNRTRGFRNHYTKWEIKDPENGKYIWDFGIIERILQNPVYYGAIASQKADYRFKMGVIRKKKAHEWIIVENQHEPIIDQQTFDIVQTKIKKRQHPRDTDNFSLFSGLIKCGECGKALTIRKTNAKYPKDIYSCVTYNKFGKEHCTQHRVDYDVLYQLVLDRIRLLAKATLADEKSVEMRLESSYAQQARVEQEASSFAIAKAQDRIQVLDRMISRLYEDMIAGRVNEANFETLLSNAQREQTTLKEQIEAAQNKGAEEEQKVQDAKAWTELIKEYADITELDSETLNRLIKEIIVHETIDEEKNRNITIEIHFNFKAIPEVSGTGNQSGAASGY
jgi:DNA invertase Pin-like site-specific DNA recombinase